VGTDPANFVGDADPSSTTDPKVADTDLDGIADGTEDLDRDGKVDSGEADPQKWDTDNDGLPDGNVTIASVVVGEDLNRNGVRDQDADGNWTETDFLANDSDVDGVLDGDEVNGTYCFATETGCTAGAVNNATRILDPLNPDHEGDGLRDGQEVAGWKVAT